MIFAYEDLSPDQFEKLIIFLCQKLLGLGVQGFSTGPDGGRDAKFVGTAELHPSRSNPWSGTVIVQGKHTNGYNRHFAESDFFSPDSQSTIIAKEMHRIRGLREAGRLDFYMLFSNRRLAGNVESDIRSAIAVGCGLPEESIFLCGVEQLEVFLRTFPDVAKLAQLNPIDSPLIVSSEELAVVVEGLARHEELVKEGLEMPPQPRVPYEVKNSINRMSQEYARELRKRYLKETTKIQEFLSAPENDKLMRLYESVVSEFQLKIIAKRGAYQSFDDVMNYIADLLFARDPILRQTAHKRLTRAILFYMYWNCDIGESTLVEAD